MDNVAWDVPNSNLIVNVIYQPKTFMKPAYYQSGVMIKSGISNNISYMVLTGERSDNRFGALENMIGRITSIIETWHGIFDNLSEDVRPSQLSDWWNWPSRIEERDLVNNCFKGVADCDKMRVTKGLTFRNMMSRVLKSDRFAGYVSGIISDDGKIYYADSIKSDRQASFLSLTTHLAAVGMMLDKLQDGSWLALVSNDSEDYVVKSGDCRGGCVIESKKKEVAR